MRRLLVILGALALVLVACGHPAAIPTSAVQNPPPESNSPKATLVTATIKTLPGGGSGEIQTYTFADATHGWLVKGNAIWASTDGGQTWTKRYEHDSAVTGLDFISAERGWVAADDGLLATSDGGMTWQRVPAAGEHKFARVDFVDADHGWAYADQALIVTGDGGATWEPVATPCTGPKFGFEFGRSPFSFVSRTVGFMVCGGEPSAGAQPKQLYRTGDGGRTWRAAGDLMRSGYISDLYFLDENRGYFSKYRGVLMTTTDGGKNWAAVPGLTYHESEGAVQFVSPDRGFLAIQAGHTWLFGTRDGGKSWTLLHPGIQPQNLLPNQIFDMQTWVATGTRLEPGAILWTHDGGSTWTQVGDLGKAISSISFGDRQHGWAVAEGSLYQTADGGATWTSMGQPASVGNRLAYQFVSMVDAQTAYVVANRDLVRTTDGGRSFTDGLSRAGEGLIDLQFSSRDTGWKIENFKLYATADGGNTWTHATLQTRALEVQPLPGGDVWVLGGQLTSSGHVAALFSSADGGKTWTQYDLGSVKVAGVRFLNATHGLMMNQDGSALFATTDGGHTWTQIH